VIPENSLAAFRLAIEEGYGIELDVQRAGDGTPVVFHDSVLDRLTAETGAISRRSAAQLATVTLGGTAESIPSLRQALTLIGGRQPVLIELKSSRGTRIAALCLAVRRVLEGYTGPHAVMSFDPRVSRWYRRHSPHTVRGLIVSEGEDRALPGKIRRRAALWQAGPDFLAYDIRDLPVATWTVRRPDHHERAGIHADAVIFERPSEEPA
jgi:glycerophosphoryl diester phosphodiesterase